MTYCLGILLEQGLVMIADTRTNAGVDNVSSFRKLHLLASGPDREIHAATCGNLSASQAVLNLIEENSGLDDAVSMFRAAEIVGDAVRTVNVARETAKGSRSGASCLLLGGRIGSTPPRLFLVYEEGNFIECKPDVPFLQIGETKYGRPILDRIVSRSTPLPAAVKIGLLSFDSAIRSNLAVSRPLDLLVMPSAPGSASLSRRIEKDDDYFDDLSRSWSALLYQATLSIPDPHFMIGPEPLHQATVSELRR